MADPGASDRPPTWRDGILLTAQEKAALTAEQRRQYCDDSVVRELSEIDQMPEPVRSWARGAVQQARARAEARAVEQSSREAS